MKKWSSLKHVLSNSHFIFEGRGGFVKKRGKVNKKDKCKCLIGKMLHRSLKLTNRLSIEKNINKINLKWTFL